jgi:hypothetical protein
VPGAHRDVSFYSGGVEEAHPVTDAETDVVADYAGSLYTEVIEKTEDVLGQALHAVSASRNVRPAKAAKVGADHPVPLVERANEVPPHPPVLGPSVEENHRIPASRFGVVQAHAIDIDVVVGYAGHIWEKEVGQFGSCQSRPSSNSRA